MMYFPPQLRSVFLALAVLLSLGISCLHAQDAAAEFSPDPDADASAAEAGPGAISTAWETRTDARTLTLAVPAPRGQIVDRNGMPLVQNRMGYYLALQFPLMEDPSDEDVLAFARGRLEVAASLLGEPVELSDERILKHYEHRRWLPLVISSLLSDQKLNAIEAAGEPGLIPHPFYLRYYPHGTLAAHVLGYVGYERALPTGAIEDQDPVFREQEGRYGLEKSFDEALRGDVGLYNVLFDTDGTRLNEEVVRRPMPGDNVVTTIDLDYQRAAEVALSTKAKSGSMVVIDVRTGDILVMASTPSFDPNAFADGIGHAAYNKLVEDPRLPLLPRAQSGEYPPASTFKVVVALAALEKGIVERGDYYNCGTSMWIGDREFHNWNKKPEGQMNVVSAIKRSCNTWFYQVGIKTGADGVADMAQRLGFGAGVGIPIAGEQDGYVPTNEEWREKHGYSILDGDLANISIGQGAVLSTPLQVARAMGSLAMGEYLPRLRLVSQVQDLHDNVVDVYPPPARMPLDIHPDSILTVKQGMVAVVSSGNGTGRAAGIDLAQVAGKTGTAQWKISEKRELAWFAGFVPASRPRYAFAVVYEGGPGEKVSGGAKAAPIVHDVLDKMYAKMSLQPELYEELSGDVETILPEDLTIPTGEEILTPDAVPAEGEVPPPPPPQKRGLLDRLFGR